jgi:predicted dehydrogenase
MDGVLIGAGFFAQFHAEAWRRLPGARLTAVSDAQAERARAFAAQVEKAGGGNYQTL